MTLRILQTLITCLLVYQGLVGIPYELVRDGCFDEKYDRYPQWFAFPDDYMDVLDQATQTGTRIGCFHRPKGDRAGSLWNERWDNEVVILDREATLEADEIDYLYLRPDLDADWISLCEDQPEVFELMIDHPRWGTIWKTK